MKKITWEEFDNLFGGPRSTKKGSLWSRIQEVQSSEPMSVDGDCKKAFDEWFLKYDLKIGTTWDDYYNAFKAGFSITVQQGFVPDWSINSKATEWRPYWIESGVLTTPITSAIPRPAPKMRPKTREEKVDDLRGNAIIMNWLTIGQLQNSTIDDLCRAAGISLEGEA